MRWKIGILLTIAMLLISLPVRAAEAETLTEQEVMELAEGIGDTYCLCPELLQSVAWQESRYDARASNEGCEGLLQVNEKWHRERMKRLGVTDLYDPEENMLVAADYLSELFAEHEDAALVLMIYNGDSRAEEYSQGIGEMSNYAAEILTRAAQLEREHGK